MRILSIFPGFLKKLWEKGLFNLLLSNFYEIFVFYHFKVVEQPFKALRGLSKNIRSVNSVRWSCSLQIFANEYGISKDFLFYLKIYGLGEKQFHVSNS